MIVRVFYYDYFWLFFFFKQKTAYELRISDWSSDVCSSDLCEGCAARFTTFERIQLRDFWVVKSEGRREPFDREKLARSVEIACRKREIGRASCRERVCQYV